MPKEVADALFEYQVRNANTHEVRSLSEDFMYATWIQSESVDSNLSKIRLADSTVISGVPKLAHVTGLTYGNNVMCVASSPSKVITIIGIVVGDIRLYEA